MRLDNYIRIQLTVLSKKYDISVVEVTKGKDNRVSKSYTINYKNKETKELNKQKRFCSKKELVSWLMCLE